MDRITSCQNFHLITLDNSNAHQIIEFCMRSIICMTDSICKTMLLYLSLFLSALRQNKSHQSTTYAREQNLNMYSFIFFVGFSELLLEKTVTNISSTRIKINSLFCSDGVYSYFDFYNTIINLQQIELLFKLHRPWLE